MSSDRYGEVDRPDQPLERRSVEGVDFSAGGFGQASDFPVESYVTVAAPLGTPHQSWLYMDEATTLHPGHRLGSFRILQHIGSGGMGQVYRALDQRLDRDVAIKILPRAFGRDPWLLSRFQAEARAASALNHPNIVAIHDIGREDDLCWIVSELVEGHSLRAALETGQLSARRIIEIGSQIAEGLAAAHAAGFIHRDLKPENIMLTRDDRVKILDFGLAKSAVRSAAAAASSASANVTQAGVIVGTPGYMSPEQIVGGSIDQRSDIFSLGVILYEMLAGTRPFGGNEGISIVQATLTENPPALPLAVPSALTRITERCLEKKPERRLQSAADVAFALQMAAGSGAQALVRKQPWRLSRRWAAMLIGSACLVAAAALFWAGLRMHPMEQSMPGSLRRLTWDDALTTDGAISPDGQFVAYASDRADGRNLNIFVQQADGGGTLQLTNNLEANDEPVFSPDGARIAFESRHGSGGIYEVPALGGAISLIADGGRHPRFSPDGRFILYAKVGSEGSVFGGSGAHLFVQPVSGGTPVLVTQGCSQVVAEAVWSPDSKNILGSASCNGRAALWLFSANGKSRQETNGGELWAKLRMNSTLGLAFQNLDQWLTNPERILLSVTEGDTQYEVTVPIAKQGRELQEPVRRINFGPGMTIHGSASEDGRIALTFRDYSSNLWELPIDSGGQATGKPLQLTRSQAVLRHPTLSRDGRKVAFVLAQSGRDELQVLDLESHGVTSVTMRKGLVRHPVFSPDGSKISYQAENAPLEIGTNGGSASEILARAGGYVSDWSADGRRFLWFQQTPDRSKISIVDRASSKMTLMLDAPGFLLYQPHFSAGGEYVIFSGVGNQHSRIYAAPIGPKLIPVSDWIPLTDGTTWDDKPRVSADGKLLFFVSNRDGFLCIWVQPLTSDMHATGEAEAVYHSHLLRRSLAGAGIGDLELNVFRDKLIFTQAQSLGNIWVMDPHSAAH